MVINFYFYSKLILFKTKNCLNIEKYLLIELKKI